MAGAERITAAITAARTEGRVPLIAFLTAGFPRKEGWAEDLHSACMHADVVEIGVPFTDPMADGVTIQRSSQAALAAGVNLRWILAELADLTPRPETPLLLMSYLNPLLAYGVDRLAADAARAGVCGFIVPDMPLDESDDFQTSVKREGLALVQLVTPVTPEARLARLCAASTGFVYAVTMTGTTGGETGMPADVLEYLQRIKAHASVPVCAGFGIRSREQVAAIGAIADGVIVGSALVEAMERGTPVDAFLEGLRAQA